MTPEKMLLLFALLAGIAAFVAAPAAIALIRRHPDRGLICKLSPLALLSFVLWFFLMAWACTGTRNDAVISRYVTKLRDNRHLPLVIAGLVVLGLVGSLVAVLR